MILMGKDTVRDNARWRLLVIMLILALVAATTLFLDWLNGTAL
jgi:hypothetical protein